MDERLRESLSALMDDEGDDLELGRVLRAMDGDDEVRETWSRYHLASAVLRGQRVGVDFATPTTPVAEAIGRADHDAARVLGDDARSQFSGSAGDDSSADDAPRRRAFGAWPSFAAAATVTLAVVLGVQWQGAVGPGEGDASRTASTAAASGPVRTDLAVLRPALERASPLRLPSPRGQGVQPASSEAERRVDAFMLRHAEINALNARAGMMPFARYASFGGDRGSR